MIQDAEVLPDDSIELDGLSVRQCIVIGRVLTMVNQANRVVLELNDNTGTL